MEEGASLPVAEWLRALHLDQYLESFEKNGLWKVSDCRNLTDEALTRIGILLPGHRKRILFGLQKAFMEASPATEGPAVAARRPVPMKRNIFRSLLTEPENPAGLSQVPPPIPPRLGCRPPVKFSSASPPVSAELSPAVPCCSEPPSFADFAPPLPAPLAASLPPPPRCPRPHPHPHLTPSIRLCPFSAPSPPPPLSAWLPAPPPSLPETTKPPDSCSGSGNCLGVKIEPWSSAEGMGILAGIPSPPSTHTVPKGCCWPRSGVHPRTPPTCGLCDHVLPTAHMGKGGSYIYQKRWVKLDADYLRYFDSEKDTYSKRFIPVTSIARVASIGDQKFEVITNNRTFAFRAESDADRNEWMRTLQQMVDERKFKGLNRISLFQPAAGAVDAADKCGLLELRGFKNKLFVVVAGDKVFLFKNAEDYRQGIGITYIEMNVGNVKDVDRRGFDLTTPYKIFSFSADSDQEKDEWVEAMQQSIAEALSNSEVAEKIWSVEANRFCADCRSPKPDWASVNLCVVICKRCAGEHRGLGPSITKVRSLKMDRKVWTEELIELFCQVGNCVANQFWAANVPPSEAIHTASGSQERRRFLVAKYKEGKYRRYHPLFGNQEELNKALCATVTTSDLAETQSLVFCGAEVSCFSGDPDFPNPVALAEQAGQKLQMEFLLHNKNSGERSRWVWAEPPTLVVTKETGPGPPAEDCRAVRASLEKSVRVSFLPLFSLSPLRRFESTFEVYIESERLYLFGLDNPEAIRKWVKSIAKSFIHPRADELVSHDFERIGRLQYKGGLNLERAKEGWFALTQSTLYALFEDSEKEEALHLKKLQELSVQGDSLVLVERRRTLYIQGERKLDFLGWVAAIQKAAGSSGDTLSEQQLTESDIPVIVDRCIDYITQCGLTSEGIYRKSGQNSKTTSLLEMLRRDARRVRLKEGEHQVDDVSNTLKRFFRDLGDGLFTKEFCQDWLKAAAIEDEEEKIGQYHRLLSSLPLVNRATVKALINHLYRVQYFSDMNQMTTHNLAIVFGPTLFQTDGKDYKAGRVVEDLISRYVVIFSVDEQEMRKQQDEITAIIKMRIAGSSSGTQHAGDFICTVYLEEKKTEAEQHIKIPATMTAEELTFEILERRKIVMKEKEYWSCFEVNEREEAERPLHYSEKVLPILHDLGTDSYLVVKKQLSMENMLIYLASRVGDSKHGMMKFREERNLLGLGLSTGFHDRYFILNHSCLRLYKEVRSHRPEKEWPVKNLKVYLGIKKKLRPPSCWGFTVFYENEKHEKQQWYLCCDTQMELREWFATFLHVQVPPEQRVAPQHALPSFGAGAERGLSAWLRYTSCHVGVCRPDRTVPFHSQVTISPRRPKRKDGLVAGRLV
uniref:ArfGAP with RhoGAP domain, ankyrin repeat and PH domain 1 n=1 Tax=Chelydra serpentina TaxID=8475 RepID=A0A8C3XSY0_CHESE